jgi:hypothetical protein
MDVHYNKHNINEARIKMKQGELNNIIESPINLLAEYIAMCGEYATYMPPEEWVNRVRSMLALDRYMKIRLTRPRMSSIINTKRELK